MTPAQLLKLQQESKIRYGYVPVRTLPEPEKVKKAIRTPKIDIERINNLKISRQAKKMLYQAIVDSLIIFYEI